MMVRLLIVTFISLLLGTNDCWSQETDSIYRIVEQMPLYDLECLELENATAQKQCSNQRLIQFVFQEFKYPDPARQMSVEATIVVRFIIEKDGSMGTIDVLKDPGGGLGEEALRVFQTLATCGKAWAPGKHNGQSVRVQLSYPIKIQLE